MELENEKTICLISLEGLSCIAEGGVVLMFPCMKKEKMNPYSCNYSGAIL